MQPRSIGFQRVVLALAMWAVGGLVHAGDIFRYADEAGVLTFSDVLPAEHRYKRIRSSRAKHQRTIARTTILPDETDTTRFDSLIQDAAKRCEVDALLVKAIIKVESNFNHFAVSSVGASGLMQLMPETADAYGVTSIFDPEENIGGGVRYFRRLIDLFGGNVSLALAAYNAGETAVALHGGIPPFAETQAFVPKVLSAYRLFRLQALVSRHQQSPTDDVLFTNSAAR